MPKLTRRTALGLKTETTQGTGVTLTATDFMLVSDFKANPVPEMLERNYYRSNLSPITSIAGKRLYEFSFKTSLKGTWVIETQCPGAAQPIDEPDDRACYWSPSHSSE